ncbi:UNVERIFIED_CONTAM: hypothetical protein Sangu_1858700 [Sesamum angustifolium]|uniref:Retrotransposon Copia-like N-terminal domain-containing protein n=1 Tax=Sesamum angustifolium TaxID=2727405 RepID=A0AAW2MBL6_9LAMI
MKLQISKNPGMCLVSSLLNGKNYLSWSRSMRIASGAKMKMSFINGKSINPKEDLDECEQWREIASVSQGNLSVSEYYAKLKRLWDELTCLKPMLQCECGASKIMAEMNLSNQLM